jgi:DNA-binding GntR family transcriptional regulator
VLPRDQLRVSWRIVSDGVCERIADGELKPGDPLSRPALARDFDTSSTSVDRPSAS